MSENILDAVKAKMKEEKVEFDCDDDVLVNTIIDTIIGCTIGGLCSYHGVRECNDDNWPCIDGVMFSLQEHPYEKYMYSFCMSDAGRRATTSDELLECINNEYKSLIPDYKFDGIDTYKIRVILTSLFDCIVASKNNIYGSRTKEPEVLLRYMDDLDKEYVKSYYAESGM